MTRRAVLLVVLFCVVLDAHAQPRGAVDWIFLVDTSKSMRGVGGTKNIFPDVKASIRTFIREASAGDSVTILTFDRDVDPHGSTDIRQQLDRDDLLTTIDHLKAEGDRTHLGLAISKGLERSEQLLLKNDPSRQRAIVLFTDGKEDVRGIKDPVRIADNIMRVPVSHPWIFFVSMGDHEAQLDTFPSSHVLRATDPDAIKRVAYDIRKEISAPPPPKPAPRAPEPARPEPLQSPFVRLIKWLAAIAVLLLLGVIALVLYSGKMPRLLASITDRSSLEGELEIIQPRTPGDTAFIGLTNLKSKEINLSAIVPPEALAGADARLFCRRRDGEKRVWIAAHSGTVRVNDIEVPQAELYDADTIQLGDARLRFNRIGFHRPSQEDFA